jgi:hypothetical protein
MCKKTIHRLGYAPTTAGKTFATVGTKLRTVRYSSQLGVDEINYQTQI